MKFHNETFENKQEHIQNETTYKKKKKEYVRVTHESLVDLRTIQNSTNRVNDIFLNNTF